MFKLSLKRLLTFFLASTLFGCKAQSVVDAEGEISIVADLVVLKQNFTPDENIVVGYSLKNASAHPVQVLPWGTPLENPLTADNFHIERDGEVLPYAGIMVKRAAPTAADYITLAADETIKVDVQLMPSYDMRRPGTYEIRLKKQTINTGAGTWKLMFSETPLTLSRTAE